MSILQVAVARMVNAAIGNLPVVAPNPAAVAPRGNHFLVTILPAATLSVGLTTVEQEIGLIQVTVRTRLSIGADIADGLADNVLSLFYRGLVLVDGSNSIRLDKAGWKAPALSDAEWYSVPVTIPYVITR